VLYYARQQNFKEENNKIIKMGRFFNENSTIMCPFH